MVSQVLEAFLTPTLRLLIFAHVILLLLRQRRKYIPAYDNQIPGQKTLELFDVYFTTTDVISANNVQR